MEVSGIWINYGKGGKFLVARSGGANTKFAKMLEFNLRPHDHQMKIGKLDNEVATDLLIDTFIDAVLLKWEGVSGKDGKEIKFTKENAKTLFTDLPELFRDLQEQTSKMSNFQEKQTEDDAGN